MRGIRFGKPTDLRAYRARTLALLLFFVSAAIPIGFLYAEFLGAGIGKRERFSTPPSAQADQANGIESADVVFSTIPFGTSRQIAHVSSGGDCFMAFLPAASPDGSPSLAVLDENQLTFVRREEEISSAQFTAVLDLPPETDFVAYRLPDGEARFVIIEGDRRGGEELKLVAFNQSGDRVWEYLPKASLSGSEPIQVRFDRSLNPYLIVKPNQREVSIVLDGNGVPLSSEGMAGYSNSSEFVWIIEDRYGVEKGFLRYSGAERLITPLDNLSEYTKLIEPERPEITLSGFFPFSTILAESDNLSSFERNTKTPNFFAGRTRKIDVIEATSKLAMPRPDLNQDCLLMGYGSLKGSDSLKSGITNSGEHFDALGRTVGHIALAEMFAGRVSYSLNEQTLSQPGMLVFVSQSSMAFFDGKAYALDFEQWPVDDPVPIVEDCTNGKFRFFFLDDRILVSRKLGDGSGSYDVLLHELLITGQGDAP